MRASKAFDEEKALMRTDVIGNAAAFDEPHFPVKRGRLEFERAEDHAFARFFPRVIFRMRDQSGAETFAAVGNIQPGQFEPPAKILALYPPRKPPSADVAIQANCS